MNYISRSAASSLLLSLLLASGSDAARNVDASALHEYEQDVRVVRDIAYVAGTKLRSQKLDLYVPSNVAAPIPVIVWIHGGSWSGGDKSQCPAEHFLPPGYAVASINYRLSGEAPFPAQMDDCAAAIAWLQAHGKDYGIDSSRIGLWGVSAGAHLASLVATRAQSAPQSVRAVCAWSGPSDLISIKEQLNPDQKSYWEPRQHQSPIAQLMGGDISPTRLRNASPTSFVSANAPPFFLVHGDADEVVPVAQSEELYDALRKHSVDASLFIAKGQGHYLMQPECLIRTLRFFDAHLKS